ncbi:MAG: TolC family protein [Planctomycetia bacterium]|nr:TolC family protein [Planctomycetia bacterium]
MCCHLQLVRGASAAALLLALGCAAPSPAEPSPSARSPVFEAPQANPLGARSQSPPVSQRTAEPNLRLVAHQDVSGAPGANEIALPIPATDEQEQPEVVPPRPADAVTLDLPTALQIADGENLQIQFARERIAAAQAQYQRATALWLPTLSVGSTWLRHDGQIQDTRGGVITVSRSAAFAGGGAVLSVSTSEAIYAPREAGQVVAARRWGARAERNEALLAVSLAYWDLVRARTMQEIQREAVANTKRMDDLAQAYLKAGEKLKEADGDRVRAELRTRQQELELSAQDVQVASARLARLLRLDPFTLISPEETTAVPIELADAGAPPGELAATALSNRPELAESRSLAQAAAARLRQAEVGPLLPSLLLDYSAGGFGGGANGFFGNFDGRSDVEAAAVWQLHNLGLGDRALARERASELRQSQLQSLSEMDRVVTETAQAAAKAQARRAQLEPASQAVESARQSFERNLKLFTEGGIELILPIEVLQSINAFTKAQQDYLNAVIEHNKAQFELHWAQGFPGESAYGMSDDNRP